MSFTKLSPHFKTKIFKLKSRFSLFWENSERRDHSSSVGPYGHPSPHSRRRAWRPGPQGRHSAVSSLVPFNLLRATQSVLPDCGLRAGWGELWPPRRRIQGSLPFRTSAYLQGWCAWSRCSSNNHKSTLSLGRFKQFGKNISLGFMPATFRRTFAGLSPGSGHLCISPGSMAPTGCTHVPQDFSPPKCREICASNPSITLG